MPSGLIVQALCCVDEPADAERVAEAALAAARRAGSFIADLGRQLPPRVPRHYRGELADALADLDQAQATRREGWESGDGLAAGAAGPRPARARRSVDGGRGRLALAAAAPRGSMDLAVLRSARPGSPSPTATRRGAALASAAGRELQQDFGIDGPGFVPWRRTAALAALALGEERRAPASWPASSCELARGHGAARPLAWRCGPRRRPRPRAPASCWRRPWRLRGQRAAPGARPRAGRARRRDAAGGRGRDAQRPLREALELADRMRASALAETDAGRSCARPRSARAAPRSRGSTRSPPAERRVARLAADGLTNREIAQELSSPRRPSRPPLSVYRKLGLGSRRSLPALLAEPSAGAGRGDQSAPRQVTETTSR